MEQVQALNEDKSLESRLIHLVSARAKRHSPRPGRLECPDRSLLSSAWQKAIRRGAVDDALQVAAALEAFDPAYVWRRIRGIAMEEVSIADPSVVAMVLAIAGKARLREALGPWELLGALTTALAEAPKCRTACDLLVWLPAVPEPHLDRSEPIFNQWALGRAERQELLVSASRWRALGHHSLRTSAGWRSVLSGDPACRDAWLARLQFDPLVSYCVRRGNGTDGLNLLAVPARQLAMVSQVRVRGLQPPACSEALVGGVRAYAYCLYSKPGRQALGHFLSSDQGWRRRLVAAGARDLVRALGHLVFHVEGSYCAERLIVHREPEIREQGELASLARCGVAPEHVPGLRADLVDALPSLNEARLEIARRLKSGRNWRESDGTKGQ